MTALTAAQAMAEGIHRVQPDAVCDIVPIADGGEGTVAALVDALGGLLVDGPCHDALGRATTGVYGYVAHEHLAVIEIAVASGLAQIAPAERDPLRTTSFGVGELVRDALDRGARRFIVGLGGSATNDAGAGMSQALGARLLDAAGDDLPAGGAALARLARIELSGLDPRLADCHFQIACDVDNPLLGPAGASRVFSPQKGANPHAVRELEAALTRWAEVVEATTGRRVRKVPGAGAGGGLGAGFAALLDVSMRRGVDIVIGATRLKERMAGAAWVFTGEGSIDGQTLHGKVPSGVAATARAAGVGVVMFGGRVLPEAAPLLDDGVWALVPISPASEPLSEALARGPEHLADAAEMTLRRILREGGGASRQSELVEQSRSTARGSHPATDPIPVQRDGFDVGSREA
jgi:glycerate kinase